MYVKSAAIVHEEKNALKARTLEVIAVGQNSHITGRVRAVFPRELIGRYVQSASGTFGQVL